MTLQSACATEGLPCVDIHLRGAAVLGQLPAALAAVFPQIVPSSRSNTGDTVDASPTRPPTRSSNDDEDEEEEEEEDEDDHAPPGRRP